MDLGDMGFSFNVYHDGAAVQAGPPPAYASDPSGIIILVLGLLAIIGLLVYFKRQNDSQK